MILILENGKLSLIGNHKSKVLLGANIDINTVTLQEVGKYYFGDGEIQCMPDVPAVVSMERGDSLTQHLSIQSNEVNTYFNELYVPPEFSKDDLPFEFLRGIKDGYKLSKFHTRVWVFDRKFQRHFNLVRARGFSMANVSLLDNYMELYKTFSSISDIGLFSIDIEKIYENLEKFTGGNYDELHKWDAKITPQVIKVEHISWKDLTPIQTLDATVDPRSAELKKKVPLPLTTAVPAAPEPAKEKGKEKATAKVKESVTATVVPVKTKPKPVAVT